MKKILVAIALMAVGINGANATSLGPYKFVDLGAGPMGAYSIAYDINNQGDIVGFSNDNVYSHATLWSNGAATDLGTLYGSDFAYSINESGVSVGYATVPFVGGGTATQYLNGSIISLNTFGAGAYGINDAGDVVGVKNLSTATLWRNGTEIVLGGGSARSVNNPTIVGGVLSVQAVGLLGGAEAAKLWTVDASTQGITVTETILPSFTGYASANSINDIGQIVGYANYTTGAIAALWFNGAITALGNLAANGDPLGSWSTANDINNNGLVVGWGGCPRLSRSPNPL